MRAEDVAGLRDGIAVFNVKLILNPYVPGRTWPVFVGLAGVGDIIVWSEVGIMTSDPYLLEWSLA